MNMKKILLTLVIFLFSSMMIYAEDSPQQFQGFNLVGYGEGGKKSWDLKGDNADIVGDMVELTNLTANAYGEEQMNVTAQTGIMNKANGQMHLEKDVVMTTQTGAKLTTDSLDWDREKDLVQTDDKVVLTKDDMTATGTGAIGHPNLRSAQLNKDVTVNMKTEPSEQSTGAITITCDGPLEMEYLNEKATFNTNVVAIDGDRKLMADKIEALFDTATKQIKEMICIGNVVIIQGKNESHSDKAIYEATTKKLTLLGTPKLILYTQNNAMPSLGGEKSEEKPAEDSAENSPENSPENSAENENSTGTPAAQPTEELAAISSGAKE